MNVLFETVSFPALSSIAPPSLKFGPPLSRKLLPPRESDAVAAVRVDDRPVPF